MPNRTCRVHHSEAKVKIVDVNIDVTKEFSLEEMRACHNVRLSEAKAVMPGGPATQELHAFTADMLALFKAWNPLIGWDGCYRLPEKIEWITKAETKAK